MRKVRVAVMSSSWEYFYGANGDLFRAPSDSPLDVWGYRMGARFESTPVAAETCLKLAREYWKNNPV